MRVICLVPSLTEALVECGVKVVGRTRFCVHPAERVAGIRVVGGTKDVDWAACAALRPDWAAEARAVHRGWSPDGRMKLR